jgi:NHL repeat
MSWGWSVRAGSACAATLAFGAAVGVSQAEPVASNPYVISAFAGTGTGGSPTPGPATVSDLLLPYGDAVDAQGNVYIADLNNGLVEKVTPAGALSIVAGDGGPGPIVPGPARSTGLPSPTGVAVGSDGTVYVADFDASLVYKISPAGMLSIVTGVNGSSGPPTPGPATSSTLDEPYAVAVDANGNVYVADTTNNEVEEVTPSGILSIVAGTGTSGPPTPGPATSSDLDFPEGVAIDSSGNLYIGDANNNVVEKVTPSGTLSVIAGSGRSGPPTPGLATSSDLDNPAGLSSDAAGNVYFADVSNEDIEEITPTGTLSVIAGDGSSGAPTYGASATASSLDNPATVASTPAGRLYVADAVNNTIDLLAPAAPVNTTPPSISGTAQTGQALTATEGSWTHDPIIYTYQWQDCDAAGTNCMDIPAATSNTYTLASSDAGHTVRVLVTAENGGGSTVADASVSGVIATSTTTAPTTTTATPVAGADETTGSRKVRGQSAVLGGLVTASAGPVTYRFQYGPTRRYSAASTVKTLAASTTARAVTTTVSGLLPGSVYHYRLVVTDAAGAISYGADKTLETPRVKPRRVRDHIYSYWDQHAPYKYRVHGRLILPRGLGHAAACRTRGTVTITATTAHKVIALHHVKMSAACTYTSIFRLTATQLPGSGRASFRMSYAGNRQLRARQARTLNILYGPNAKPRA